jgi:pyridoxal phosphate enzyme (YggS family)
MNKKRRFLDFIGREYKITTIPAVISHRKYPMNRKSQIAENIANIKAKIPAHCKLIVVSKYREIDDIQFAYDAGQREFAENRVQPLLERVAALPNDIQWHLIGHLQSNKVKFIAPFIAMIHSVDSVKLLEEIDKEAQKNHRVIPCLIQLHVAQEETKFGLSQEEIHPFFQQIKQLNLNNISVNGIMAMASFTQDQTQIEAEFSQVAQTYQEIKSQYYSDQPRFSELSIGMSSDYGIAIEIGSTLIRVGSAVFA